MIHTRDTIYTTLKKLLNKLTKLAQYNPKVFKNVIYAVIINDLKEWSEYVPTYDSNYLVDLLERYMLYHSEFDIKKFIDSNYYVNVNTPQDNTTWYKIPDLEQDSIDKIKPIIDKSWTPDKSCIPQVIYLQGLPSKILDYSKMTICEKMNVYIDVTTGIAWYLDYDGNWKQVTTEGITKQQVLDLIELHRGEVEVKTTDNIQLNIVDKSTNKQINLAPKSKIDELL